MRDFERLLLERIEHLEESLVSTIADLTTAVAALATAAAAVPAPTTGTVLDPDDQAAVDNAVSTITSVVAELNALTAPTEAPAEPTA